MNNLIELKQDYYRKLFRKCRGKNSKRSMKEAFEYLEENYTGSTRRAITHQMFRKTWEMEVEMDLYWVLRALCS